MFSDRGELVYGSILPNGDDWRLRKFDGGMGETEYRIFRNGNFFAQCANREDAGIVMEAMIHPYNPQAIRENVLDEVLQLPQRREQPNGSMYIYVNDVKLLWQGWGW